MVVGYEAVKGRVLVMAVARKCSMYRVVRKQMVPVPDLVKIVSMMAEMLSFLYCSLERVTSYACLLWEMKER